MSHRGHPKELAGVTGALLTWAREQRLGLDMTSEPDGEQWGCRLEVYRSDPRAEPDMSDCQTDLLFRLAD